MAKDELLSRVRDLAGDFRERAEAAERARRLPQESADAMLQAGLARVLVPRRFGGEELGLDTWFDVVLEVAKADASHGWCASLMIHNPHYVAQYPEAAQQAVWANGADVAIATSLPPLSTVTAHPDGYRISGEAPFTSGILNSDWIIIGGMLTDQAPPEPALFLIPPGQYGIADTWFTTAMQATASNTAITDNVVVPREHVVRIADLREGTGPGAAINSGVIYRAPWMSYAPLTFATPILGAARGAYEYFRGWTVGRHSESGSGAIERPEVQIRVARAAADLDAAELLLRRAIATAQAPERPSLELRARSMRDTARAVQLAVDAIDLVMLMSGSSGFAAANPIQRAWRDVHFAASHVSLNADHMRAHWGRTDFGVDRPPTQLFY